MFNSTDRMHNFHPRLLFFYCCLSYRQNIEMLSFPDSRLTAIKKAYKVKTTGCLFRVVDSYYGSITDIWYWPDSNSRSRSSSNACGSSTVCLFRQTDSRLLYLQKNTSTVTLQLSWKKHKRLNKFYFHLYTLCAAPFLHSVSKWLV